VRELLLPTERKLNCCDCADSDARQCIGLNRRTLLNDLFLGVDRQLDQQAAETPTIARAYELTSDG
jgi:hypothetical protein